MGTIIKPKSTTKTLLPAQNRVAKKLLEEELKENKKRRRLKGYLTGGQVKLDKNKDGKITGEDFKMMEDKKVAGKTYRKDDPRLQMEKDKKKKRMMKRMTAAGGGMMQDKMKMMGGGMTMKDKKKMMGYMYGGKVKKMMGGGKVMKYKKGGKIDGVAIRGKTRGRNI